MPLSLKPVHPSRGAAWVIGGFTLFARRPLGFTGLFLVFLFAALIVLFVPLVGGALQMTMLPLLSLGFMVASRAAQRGDPVTPAHLVEPLTGDPARRRSMLVLCALYGAGAIGVLLLANAISDGKLAEMQALLASGSAEPKEIDAMAADRGVFLGTIALLAGGALLAVPFWHAPALVHWGGQGAGQALFSSTLAVWRAKGAFLAYGLAWLAVILTFGLGTAIVLGLIGAGTLAAMMAMPAGLLFSTVFYVSLIHSFDDSFGDGSLPSEPPPSTLTQDG